ncbi:hypothetical protein RUND412_007225 [Rhizina undulata]
MSPKGSLPQSVVSIFKKHESKSGKLKLSESQELIASLAKNFIRTTIVIDVLDECDKESREELLIALEVIMNDNYGDIAAFVRAEVDKCILRKSLLRGSVTLELKESIIERLTSGVDGMFLWVSLQIKSICDEKTSKAIDKALQRLPKSLKGTYSVIWEKICGQSEESEILAGRTLMWIMCAQSPLIEAEVIDAVSIEPLDFTGDQDHQGLKIQDLLDVCQNLIVMDKQLGVLRTAHFSVNEFLAHHFKTTEAHNHAAEICLTLMSRPKIYDEPPMPPPDRHLYSTKKPTPRPEMYDEPHPLRYYIFDYWPHHIRFSGDASNSLLHFQKQFFNASPTFYAWLQ